MAPITEKHFRSAEVFLQALQIGRPPWNEQRHHWVFRGHADDRWALIPTALRSHPPAQLGHTWNPSVRHQSTNQEQIAAEFKRLHEFFWAADAQGLAIPADGAFLRTPNAWDNYAASLKKSGWPPDGLLPVAALAQHYGIATRLLDWADKPLVAAYFAAKEAAQNAKRRRKLSVWALNLDWVVWKGFRGPNNLAVYVVTAPRGSNPNLHAQGGVFTTEHIPSSRFGRPLQVTPIDELVAAEWRRRKETVPVMCRFTLAWRSAGRLLRLLHQEGDSAATVFPGYQGAADSLKERALWDRPERASYWLL